MIRNALDSIDFCGRAEEIAYALQNLFPRVGLDGQESFDAIDLLLLELEPPDEISRFVFVTLHQLQANFLDARFVEFVEHAKYFG